MAENFWEGKIESVSHDGNGVGVMLVKQGQHLFRRPIFVPGTVPGDVVRAQVAETKRKYAFGELVEVVTPSSERREPKCTHGAGSCNLQHLSYDEQLRQKQKQVAFLLQRKGIAVPNVKILPSAERYGYRWRSKVAIRLGMRCIAGFRKKQSHEIVPVTKCWLVHDRINMLLGLLNGASCPVELETEALVVVGEKGKLGVFVTMDDISLEKRQPVKSFFEDLYACNRKLIGNVFFSEGGRTRSYGQVQEHFTYRADGLTFSFLPETFIQANVPTNTTLVQACMDLLFPDGNVGDVVLDLYAGIGNLSLPAAKRAHAVAGVDGSKPSVLAAVTNALRNGIGNATFHHMPVERYLREYVKSTHAAPYSKAAKAIVDPPRTGLTPAVRKSLNESGIPQILYVSCNPVTLAEDLHALRYAVKRIVCVDMFPDTSHVETVVLLEKA